MQEINPISEVATLVAQTAGSAVCGSSIVAGAGHGPQTRRFVLHESRRNKARMYMKTKEEVKMSSTQVICPAGDPPGKPGDVRNTRIVGTKLGSY